MRRRVGVGEEEVATSRAIELDTFGYLEDLEEAPVDIIKESAMMMDDGMRLIFATGAILSAINFVKAALVSSRSVTCYGFFWNYFDALGGYLAAIEGYRDAYHSVRHRKTKALFASLDFFASTQLTAGTTASVLATKGVLVGHAAMVANPMGAITFAVCMWISTIKEAYLLSQAIKKTDPKYLLKDRLITCHKIDEKLMVLRQNSAENREKIAELQEQRKGLWQQAMSIARAEFRDGITGRLNQDAMTIFEDKALADSRYKALFQGMQIRKPSQADKDFVQFMKDKHKERVRTHAFGVLTWGLAAIGMTLIAAGLFFPPLMLAGIVVACVAAACKLVEVTQLDRRVYNLFAKDKVKLSSSNFVMNRLAHRQKRQRVYHSFNETHLEAVPHMYNRSRLSHETRVKLHLAYKVTRGKRLDTQEYVTEADFAKHVMSLSWWRRRSILNTAMSKYIEREALRSCSFADRLSEGDREDIVNRRVRSEYRLFSSPAEEAQQRRCEEEDSALYGMGF